VTEHEQEGFEAQLRQVKPGGLPEELMVRLRTSVVSSPAATSRNSGQSRPSPDFLQILKWLIPATAAILITAVIWRNQQDVTGRSVSNTPSKGIAAAATPLLKADNVQIGKELVSSFDAVAMLPGGEPVRFRCQQWMNKVVVDDEKQGLLVESRSPRFVVVPVGFETY